MEGSEGKGRESLSKRKKGPGTIFLTAGAEGMKDFAEALYEQKESD